MASLNVIYNSAGKDHKLAAAQNDFYDRYGSSTVVSTGQPVLSGRVAGVLGTAAKLTAVTQGVRRYVSYPLPVAASFGVTAAILSATSFPITGIATNNATPACCRFTCAGGKTAVGQVLAIAIPTTGSWKLDRLHKVTAIAGATFDTDVPWSASNPTYLSSTGNCYKTDTTYTFASQTKYNRIIAINAGSNSEYLAGVAGGLTQLRNPANNATANGHRSINASYWKKTDWAISLAVKAGYWNEFYGSWDTLPTPITSGLYGTDGVIYSASNYTDTEVQNKGVGATFAQAHIVYLAGGDGTAAKVKVATKPFAVAYKGRTD